MKKLLKTIYNLFPFKKEIFTVLKTIWIPDESVYKHLHFKDVFTVSINNSKKFKMNHLRGLWIENEIFWRGLTSSWKKNPLNFG